MSTPKRLDFSSPGAGGDSDDASPPSPSSFPRRKSLRKPALKLPASNPIAEEETRKKKKKKKKKLVSPTSKRIWNEEDELTILKKGLVEFRNKTRLKRRFDWDAFYHFTGGSIVAKVSKDQLLSKIKKLKKRFLGHLEKISEGKDPLFTRSSDSQAFGFSMMIWGPNEAETANGDMDKAQQIENGEETLKDDEEVADGEPFNDDNGDMDKAQENDDGDETFKEDDEVNENGATQIDFNSNAPREVVVDKITENGTTAGNESHDDDAVTDELCAVQDAFETMMLEGLSEYQKKLHLEKLMNLGTRKRKELSNEWKALRAEEIKLNIKKLRLSAKLAEAATDT